MLLHCLIQWNGSFEILMVVFVLFCIVLFVLYCIVLYCIVLYCFVLYCFVLFCIVLFCIVLFCIVSFCFVLFCIVSNYQRHRPKVPDCTNDFVLNKLISLSIVIWRRTFHTYNNTPQQTTENKTLHGYVESCTIPQNETILDPRKSKHYFWVFSIFIPPLM